MTENLLRKRIMNAEQVLGSMVFEFFSPGIAQIMKNAGCEYILYDMEHTGIELETIKWQVAACRGLGVAPMVRVPNSDYHFLARALDIGCHGIMVPMVESGDQARQIAEATRYPGRGRRGAAFGFAHDDYAPGAPHDKIEFADARTLVIAQIESERGLDAVDEIAAVDGIDVLWLGHFDLTNFLGIPGDFENPLFTDAVKCVVEAGQKYKKGLGFMCASPALATQYKALGFNMLATGTDQNLLMNGVREILQSVEEA